MAFPYGGVRMLPRAMMSGNALGVVTYFAPLLSIMCTSVRHDSKQLTYLPNRTGAQSIGHYDDQRVQRSSQKFVTAFPKEI